MADRIRYGAGGVPYVEKTEGFEVVGIANPLEDAQSQLDVLEPDLLLLDIRVLLLIWQV